MRIVEVINYLIPSSRLQEVQDKNMTMFQNEISNKKVAGDDTNNTPKETCQS